MLEWGDFVAVPYAARLLADAGADVVKVEPPEGDAARREGPFPGERPDVERSGLFAYLNRGKRTVRLDLATSAGRAALRRLAEAADVLIHEQRDLAASPLERSAAALQAANPRLSVVALTPFGEQGPRAGQRADDLVLLAASGIAFATPGYPDHASDAEAEPPLRPNANLGEFVSGVVGAVGAMLALLNRDRGGRGTLVEISKQEALACMLVWEHTMWAFGGFVLGRHEVRSLRTPNHYLPIADGWAVIVAYMDHHWRAFVEMMDNPAWASDPRFATLAGRGEHWEELEPLLLAWLLQQPGQALLRDAQSRGIPCAPALTIAEAIESEHLAARRFLVPSGLPGDDRGRLPGDAFVIAGERRAAGPPPRAAEATAVLDEWLAAGATSPPVPSPGRV
ncbi:MAG: CoA transferase, partial [Chloroflexi bacterium]|nr:CoA transferase [Chloroflexota bacterium]